MVIGATSGLGADREGFGRVGDEVTPEGLIECLDEPRDHASRRFVPYGPSRAGAEALSLIMAEGLRPTASR